MALNTDYTTGSITRGMLRFSVPYLVSCFLQTFYGMADLFITGQFHTSGTITAVAVGSQIQPDHAHADGDARGTRDGDHRDHQPRQRREG